MCGRYANASGEEAVERMFGVTELVGDTVPPSWNVAPTDPARIVIERATGPGETARQLLTARWGLIPWWMPDAKGAASRINARVETVSTKPAYRVAASRQRGLVPATGYFEWQVAPGGTKVPHFLHRGTEVLAFAGLYERWRDPALDPDDPRRDVWTFTILTRPAPDALGHIHDRSPILVPRDLVAPWLDPGLTDPSDVEALLRSMPVPLLTPTIVSSAVNSVRNDGPHLVRPAACRSRAPELTLPGF